MNVQRLAPALRPHLPGRVETSGPGTAQLRAACDAHAQAPATAPNPYPAGLPDPAATSRELSDLAGRAQADFAAKVGNPAAELRVSQLRQAAEDAAAAARVEARAHEGAIKSLKSAYYRQVGCTAAWMGATVATLVAGGVFPNPITGLAIAGAAAMCIRSIGKSREKHKELQQRVPVLEDQARFARQVAADAAFCAPLLKGWGDLLSPATLGKAA